MALLPLPEDGVIREPGAYRIPLDVYHGQICDGPSFSSSGLRTIYLNSPKDFWAFSPLNPAAYPPKPPSEAMIFGRAAHALILGDEVFMEHFVVLPQNAPPRPDKRQLAAAAKGSKTESYLERAGFWDAFDTLAEGRMVLQPEWMETIRSMSHALADDPLVGPLFQGEAEVSLFWKDEATGLWLKARPDMVPAMGDIHADLKSTRDPTPRACLRDTRKLGYDMQLGLSAVGEEVLFGQVITAGVLVFVGKEPPFHVTPIEVDEEALHWAKLKLRAAIDTAARCLETGDWPGYTAGAIPKFTVPEWEREAFEAAQKAGTMPRSFWNEPAEEEASADD